MRRWSWPNVYEVQADLEDQPLRLWPLRLGLGRRLLKHLAAARASTALRSSIRAPSPVRLTILHRGAVSMPAGGDAFGTFIARMVECRSGYGREATGTGDDWSRTVDELLKVTAGLAFTYAAGLKGSQHRGVGTLAFMVDRYPEPFGWRSSSPPPEGGRPEEPPAGPGEGINLVHIGIISGKDERG